MCYVLVLFFCLFFPPRSPIHEWIRVVYDQDEIVAFDKPHDVRMDGEHATTMEKIVAARFPGRGDGKPARFAHRLDYATSGVLVTGFTRRAVGSVARSLQMRRSKKTYVAIVHGHVTYADADRVAGAARALPDTMHARIRASVAELQAPFILIDAAIGQDLAVKDRCLMRVAPGPAGDIVGRDATTAVTILARGTFRGQKVTKVRLALFTGRSHQLRVHLGHIGHPIFGDYTYSPGSPEHEGEGTRMMLHALRMEIQLRGEGDSVVFETEDPFEDLLEDAESEA
jgi:23S rRNA-/tRNA-specific pseudouridylate synthase